MKDRIIGSAIFIIVITAFMFLREINVVFFDVLVLFLMAVGSFELCRALKDYLVMANYLAVAMLVAFILPVYLYSKSLEVVFILFMAYFWATAIISIYSKGYGIQNLSSAMLVGIYPILLFMFMIDINHWDVYGRVALVLIFATGPLCDVFAFLVGSLIGGKKLCPSVSPNKTISGAIGGMVGGVVGSLLVYFVGTFWDVLYLPYVDITFYIGFGLVCSIFSEFGDLIESSIKRSLNVKDMGKILIGHGGVLDRFDGVLFVVFVTYIYFKLFLNFI